MALHISRVRISNFRNFAECVIAPFPTPAVIVGENGVGKSNLLYALRVLLDPDLPDSARQLRPEDIHDRAIGPFGPGLAGGAEVTIEVGLSGFDDDDEAVAALSGALTRVGAPMEAVLTYRFAPRALLGVDPETGGVAADQDDQRRPLTPADYDFRVMKKTDPTTDASRLRRLVSLRVLPALRDAEGDLARWSRSPLRTLVEDLSLDPDRVASIAADIDSVAEKLASEPEVDDLQRRLAHRLQDLVGPRLPLQPTLGIASSDPDALLRWLRLFVDATRTRSVADTSLGAANVLYLALLMEALAVRRAASAFVTTILGVEEPEAHLHVGVQRRLFRHLLQTEPALLLTTHSPHIAAVAPLESLPLLRESGTETVASTALRAGLAAHEIHDLSRYLDVSRAELLFARVVLLVEGTAELFVLPALAQALGFDLDEYGIVLVNVAGTDFGPYSKLLGADGLDVPFAVLTDGDPLPGNTSSRAEQGLRRAAPLLASAPARRKILQTIDELPELRTRDPAEAIRPRRALQDLCAEEGIFVGDETLEIDLLPLLGNELVAAYAELVAGRKAANMARDIVNLMSDDGTDVLVSDGTHELAATADAEKTGRAGRAHRMDRILSRIEARGKGRVAQRLADHVSEADVPAHVLALTGETATGGDADVLGRSGAPRACLRLLDWASRQARGRPLLDADAATSS